MKLITSMIFALFLCNIGIEAQKNNGNVESISNLSEFRKTSNVEQINYFKFEIDKQVPLKEIKHWINGNMKLGNGVSLKPIASSTDQLGITHHKYEQHYHGIPVKAGIFHFHEQAGKVVSGNGKIFKLDLDHEPCVSPKAALKIALQQVNSKNYLINGKRLVAAKDLLDENQLEIIPELVVVSKNLNYENPEFHLAWKVQLHSLNPLRHNVYFIGQESEIVGIQELLCSIDVQATAVTKYSGTKTITTDSTGPNTYRLYESGRGGGIHTLDLNQGSGLGIDFFDTDNYWNNTNAQEDEAATDAHYGAEMTYDYFYNVHGRNSYDNYGAPLISRVHYETNLANAYWDGYSALYGDGSSNHALDLPLTAMDICGHEFGHGITQFAAGLIFSGEPGALNESFSDIFGTAIEHYADPAAANWKMGEKSTSNGAGIRSMADPNLFSNPDTYKGTFWATSVHNNSGVQNYWFYLLVNGGSGVNDNGDSYNVSGIGRSKAEQIAYRNLEVYLTPSSNYSDARFYAIKAAEDIYGSCGPEAIAVMNAWHAVGVGNAYNTSVSADFGAVKSTVCQLPGEASFFALNTGITAYEWDFGDGTTSTLAYPTHTYYQTGNYTVSLKATACNGQVNTVVKQNYITVDPNSLLCDTLIMPENSMLTINSCDGVLLDPGGLEDYPDDTRSIVTIDPPGQLNLRAVVKFSDFKNIDYLKIFNGPSVFSPLLGELTATNSPNQVISTNGSLTFEFFSYDWSRDPGFVIDWEILDPSILPSAAFIVINPVLHGWPITLNNQSANAATYAWDFGDGNTSIDESPIHTYSSPGNYTVTLEATSCNGTDVSTQFVTIGNPATISVTPDTICKILSPGQTAMETVTITNSGNGMGIYHGYGLSNGQQISASQGIHYNGIDANTVHSYHNIPSNIDTVFLMVTLNGDFDHIAEYANLWIEGDYLGKIVDNDAQNGNDIITNYVLTGPQLLSWLSDETLSIEIDNNWQVGTNGPTDEHKTAIQYKGIEWLDYSNLSNTMPGNAQNNVQIVFDASTVQGGNYAYDIPVLTNDLNNPIQNIHCKLSIVTDVIADFATPITLSCDGLVQFNDQSQNSPISWDWNFGDGNTSTQQNPSNTFQNSGLYLITLIVCNDFDCDTTARNYYFEIDPELAICNQHNMPEHSSVVLTACNGMLFDHAGPNAYYFNNTMDTATIAPPGASQINFNFTLFEVASNGDFVYVFDGPDTNSPLIGTYTGTVLPPPITSSGGALTIVMTTNFLSIDEGFEATWNCLISTNSDPISNSFDFKLYPIPANELLNFELNTNKATPLKITIYNNLGQQIKQQLLNSPTQTTIQFDTSNLPAGVYFLQIEDGEVAKSKKIIIQR